MMKSFRKLIGQLHLWLGLASGLVVFIVSLTGCMYVFEEELRDVFHRKYYYADEIKENQHSLFEISEAVKKAFPNEQITQIRFKADTDAAFLYHTKSEKVISINPYTLKIQGVRDLEADFFNFILDIHLNLKMGEIGEHIIKWNVLIFFVLCISGLILWLPKQRKFLKQALTIKWKTKNWKRINWDLHSVFGFYGLFILLIVSLTGIFWVFDSAKTVVSKVTGYPITNTKPPKVSKSDEPNTSLKIGKEFAVESAYYDAKKRYSGETQTFISYPAKPDQPIRVLFRYPYSFVRKQNTLFYDKNTGKLLREDLFKNYNAYDKVMRSNYDFHTGRIRALGIWSKILYFLASLLAASLPITGTLIWWGRRKKTIRTTPRTASRHSNTRHSSALPLP
jgi:uncharacterized iron-regulated membrane protein